MLDTSNTSTTFQLDGSNTSAPGPGQAQHPTIVNLTSDDVLVFSVGAEPSGQNADGSPCNNPTYQVVTATALTSF